MKNILLITLILNAGLMTSDAYSADWTDTSVKEPTIGCAVLGGAAYLMGQSSTMSLAACALGAVAGYSMEQYYTNKVSDKYETDIKFLKSQMDEMIYQRAKRASKGDFDEGDVVWKKSIVPAKILRDGTLVPETIHLKPTLPGNNMILGE